MGGLLKCPDCKSTNVSHVVIDEIATFYPDIYCNDCGCVFELGFSMHSPDDDDNGGGGENNLDFDDNYNTGGNPDLNEVSGGRP